MDIIRSNANIALDSKQLSYVFMDTKNIIVNNASFGLDWKKPSSDPKGTTLGQLLRSGDLRDAHFGPSYVDTLTAEFGTPIGVAQYSDLGPKESLINRNDPDVPRAVRYSTVYNQIPEEDAGFYCYKSLYPLETSVTKEDAAKDVQDLLLNSNRLAKFVNFDRIYI
ncbi:hypothetical protein D3272_23535 [Lichenibacterium ramalinae]|uniref:Uncharacterized protein n=1 Tax=Lichenibacterium ramalinae TaxID=2316527 RepID=A0A4Q2RAI0_9HYPH|nr:hypothetical protein D3272_23535 [Lichenibacterium ramalinae]